MMLRRLVPADARFLACSLAGGSSNVGGGGTKNHTSKRQRHLRHQDCLRSRKRRILFRLPHRFIEHQTLVAFFEAS